MSKFDEINIGDTLGPLELFVSKDQCRAYAKLMGMGEIAGRFTDDEAAKKEGLPGMILPGNMSLGLLSKLVTDWIGSSNAWLKQMSTTYRVPVQPDHAITIHGFITNKNPEAHTAEIDVLDGERGGGAAGDGNGDGRVQEVAEKIKRLDFSETRLGFTLPWAGVTPAPSTSRKTAKTPFCSQVLFGGRGRPRRFLSLMRSVLHELHADETICSSLKINLGRSRLTICHRISKSTMRSPFRSSRVFPFAIATASRE